VRGFTPKFVQLDLYYAFVCPAMARAIRIRNSQYTPPNRTAWKPARCAPLNAG